MKNNNIVFMTVGVCSRFWLLNRNRIFIFAFICVTLSILYSCSNNDVIVPEAQEMNATMDSFDDSNMDLLQLSIYLPNTIDKINKDNYIDSTNFLLTDINSDTLFYGEGKIKGRGNSTWDLSPKKPYSFKLYNKSKLANLLEEKSWVLLANYFDPTQLRNSVASFMSSKLSLLEYTPHFLFVNLTLNNQQRGMYQLGEKLKIGKNRINVGDEGFLLEIDSKYSPDDPVFEVSHFDSRVRVNIKDPSVEVGDDNFNYIKNYINLVDSVIFSDSFADKESGYRKYIDVESFVDWYLINEICKNCDAHFWTSCYMNCKKGQKLKMGPIWDFDLACGNYPSYDLDFQKWINSIEGYDTRKAEWYERLFKDPDFVLQVKNRFRWFYDNRNLIYEYIDNRANVIASYVYADNVIWGNICETSADEQTVKKIYIERVTYLKSWIENRFEWMYSDIM